MPDYFFSFIVCLDRLPSKIKQNIENTIFKIVLEKGCTKNLNKF